MKRKLLYDPAIPLLGMYPKELKVGPQIFVFAHPWYLYTYVWSCIIHSSAAMEVTQVSTEMNG